MRFSNTYVRAVSLMARMTGRWAEHERERAQEAAFLAGAQERLEESGRLAAKLRQKTPIGPPMATPRRVEQASSDSVSRDSGRASDGVNAVPTPSA